MQIRKLYLNEEPPIELLLLAHPSRKLVEYYVKKGECYVSDHNKEIIGVLSLPTRPNTIEVVNIAVAENQQGKGIGKQLVMNAIQIAKSEGYKLIELAPKILVLGN